MTQFGLTKAQHRALEFIKDYSARHCIPPSFEEIKEHLELKSKSGVHRIIKALDDRGYITQMKNRARSIRVVRASDAKRNKHTEIAANAIAIDAALRDAKHKKCSAAQALRNIAEINETIKYLVGEVS